MKVRYKAIEHNRTEDAPFVGALLSSIDCTFSCKKCFNKGLKRMPILTKDAEELILEIKANPFNEGIIFGGLEWSLQPLELLELLKYAQKYNLKVCIYTGCSLNEFYKRIGEAITHDIGYEDYIASAAFGDTDSLNDVVGRATVDNTYTDDYYVKTGLYIREQKTDENRPFGVKLASANQRMYLFKKAEEKE